MAEELNKSKEAPNEIEQPIDKEKARQALLHLYELGKDAPPIDIATYMGERRRYRRKSNSKWSS
jgi:hypothetical protein